MSTVCIGIKLYCDDQSKTLTRQLETLKMITTTTATINVNDRIIIMMMIVILIVMRMNEQTAEILNI